MDELRHVGLALRDLINPLVGCEGQITFMDGTRLTYSPDDGCHLFTTDGQLLDLTEWIDWPGLIAVEGVESVAQQFELLAEKRDRL